ncbi:putative helicase MOV-10 [Haliotis cracherodii]|uniref:putative helicase MOV-10 n=1 Tax=Haliotis cracherodii TaxID=6455 RepID=UPI0039EAB6E0
MGKFSFKERQQRGEDFIRFLKTENITIHGMHKKEVRNMYNTRYKNYLSQLTPGEHIPSFSSILQPLYITKTLHVRADKFYNGPAPHSSGKDRSVDDVDSDSDDSIVSLDVREGAFSNPVHNMHAANLNSVRGNIRFQRKFAVDQHRHFNKAPIAEQTMSKNVPKADCLPEFVQKSGHIFRCTLCAAPCTSEAEVTKHVDGRRHRVAVLMNGLRTKRDDLIKDKFGIQLSATVTGEGETFVIPLMEGVSESVTLTIHNTNARHSVTLLSCELLKRIRVFQLDDAKKVTESQGHATIPPGESYHIKIKVQARNVGSFHSPLALLFCLSHDSHVMFHIVRYLHAKCRNDIIEQMKPTQGTKIDKRPKTRKHARVSKVVDGLPLPRVGNDRLEVKIPLGLYRIPDSLRRIINNGLTDKQGLKTFEVIEMTTLKTMLEQSMMMSEYARRLTTLMYFEEIQMEVDIRQYDIPDSSMTKYSNNPRLLLLKVPGLAENRPSVLKGDCLYVRILDSEGVAGDHEYQGYVHEVLQNEVALGFSDSLMKFFVPNMKFSVRFVFNRLPLRLQHRACELAEELSLDNLLFPKSDLIGSLGLMRPLDKDFKFFAHNPSLNLQQQMAVKHIVAGSSRPAPYLVFGPPGTGKTFTIVEAMKQIWKHITSSHILACAPSNSAADLITERLLDHVSKSEILRVNATNRAWVTIPEKIRDVCNYDRQTGHYYYPKKEDLMSCRIIVSTLVTAGRLSSANFPADHFTHVFIDEAGYAVEPECVIAIAGILDCNPLVRNGGQLVLAGDPKQLGPILRSPFAMQYGLDMSLLERYMTQHPIYARREDARTPEDAYDKRVLTKLLNNYRSHKAILQMPNEMFYDSELRVHAPEIRDLMCDWEELPIPNYPVIFHAVMGEDMREERSPSFFNPEEAVTVINYVKQILSTRIRGKQIKVEEIGIISPYRKQVQKIRQQLQKHRVDTQKLKVGSVEEFQGAERLIIIVSTVRSNPKYLSQDVKFNLGFLKNPKRFNVTVTRPKALLIVIGNPHTLLMDEHWGRFIRNCKNCGAVAGEDFSTETEQELDDVMQRLAAVNLDVIDSNPDSEEGLVVNFEQPWRKDI